MRWLCFLLLASPSQLAHAQSAGSPAPSPALRFDLTALPVTRDSFVFRLRGEERGWAVWQYEIRPLEGTQQIVYSASSEFRPIEVERLRIVLDRQSGAPISTFHHIDLYSPQSDTVMLEHDLEVKRGEVTGRRRVGTRRGDVKIIPVSRPFAPGTVLSDYVFLAGAVTNVGPGDSLGIPAYKEFADSLVTLSFVADAPTTVQVPAGRFDVLPLRSGAFRIYATRTGTRRVVKGETLDGVFSFELVHSGAVVPGSE
jgi:hypothetical protein